MKIKNTATNVALIYGGSIIGAALLTYVIAKKANIDEFVVTFSPIIGLGIASMISQTLIEEEKVSNAAGRVTQVKGRFP